MMFPAGAGPSVSEKIPPPVCTTSPLKLVARPIRVRITVSAVIVIFPADAPGDLPNDAVATAPPLRSINVAASFGLLGSGPLMIMFPAGPAVGELTPFPVRLAIPATLNPSATPGNDRSVFTLRTMFPAGALPNVCEEIPPDKGKLPVMLRVSAVTVIREGVPEDAPGARSFTFALTFVSFSAIWDVGPGPEVRVMDPPCPVPKPNPGTQKQPFDTTLVLLRMIGPLAVIVISPAFPSAKPRVVVKPKLRLS